MNSTEKIVLFPSSEIPNPEVAVYKVPSINKSCNQLFIFTQLLNLTTVLWNIDIVSEVG